MSRWHPQDDEKTGRAGLRARHREVQRLKAGCAFAFPPYTFYIFFELSVTVNCKQIHEGVLEGR